MIGQRFVNSKGQTFKVVGEEKRGDQRWYQIRFAATKAELWTKKCSILRGQVRDFKAPNILGVAAWGPKGTRARNPEAARLYRNILERCYNRRSKAFPRYGGKGVTVAPRWLYFPNFLEDLPTLPGYPRWERGEDVHLDKDLRGPVPQYGPSTCWFIDAFDNLAAAQRSWPVVFGQRYATLERAAEALGTSAATVLRCQREGRYPATALLCVFGRPYRDWATLTAVTGLPKATVCSRLRRDPTRDPIF